mmetsp:Transcript_17388/g.36675  ORF Transcript_17388/g.36675 Transcript_17388/m.36675 type:complete len:210 (-) Transcript_17388:686-1315(-)
MQPKLQFVLLDVIRHVLVTLHASSGGREGIVLDPRQNLFHGDGVAVIVFGTVVVGSDDAEDAIVRSVILMEHEVTIQHQKGNARHHHEISHQEKGSLIAILFLPHSSIRSLIPRRLRSNTFSSLPNVLPRRFGSIIIHPIHKLNPLHKRQERHTNDIQRLLIIPRGIIGDANVVHDHQPIVLCHGRVGMKTLGFLCSCSCSCSSSSIAP